MSLINDALKRAKDAQQQNPPTTDGPPLKPADPATTKAAGNAKSLLYIMVACVVIGNAFLFLYLKDRDKKTPAPATGQVSAPIIATTPAPPITAAATVPASHPAKVAAAPAVVSPAPTITPALAETNSAAAPVVAVLPEPPKPALLKLQSIIFNPSRPSAMISGKFLFVGDKVQGFRVTAIGQETVTLIGNGQTNALSLP